MQYHNFYKKRILSNARVKTAWDLYKETPMEFAHQDYSLFNVEKSIVRSNNYDNPAIVALNDYMLKNYGFRPQSHYFLKYIPYSWARVHTDNIHSVSKTIITLLEEKDLVGGDTLVWDKHYDLPCPKDAYVKRTGSVHRKSEMPCTPKLKPGQSLVYDSATRHGVTQVEEGHRIVLVSWYMK
jgi:hypothetical protein